MDTTVTQKTCQNCEKDFPIYKKDQDFYNEISPVFNNQKFPIPFPSLCPLCRMQRRLANRNERFLYHRICDSSKKQIISAFSQDKPFPVYDIDEWWSDKWDARNYGRDFDFARPFFEQFFELQDAVPRLARQHQKPNWNSDYCNCMSQNKNCYLLFSTNRCEDCYYGSWINDCKNCVDNLNLSDSELCYDCTSCRNCYNIHHSQDCSNCRNSYFLRDCIGCQDCFGCHNLNNKQYCIGNKQKTKKEYQEFIKKLNLGSRNSREALKKKAMQFNKAILVKELQAVNIENSSGNYLNNCKNAFECFECNDCEDVRYCHCIEKAKSSMDHSHWGVKTERLYECQACGYDLFNLKFCNLCWTGCHDLIYCDHCFSSKHSFGCIGLKKNEYCILNKQYEPNEYEKLVAQIITHMQSTGEWGEFFPTAKSSFCYNETVANEQVTLNKEQVLAKGWQWKSKDPKEYQTQSYEIPDNIDAIDSSICEKILGCESCGKNFKIVPAEFAFYKEQKIPAPKDCPDCRHTERLDIKNSRQLHDANCKRCHNKIRTTYSNDAPEKVVCEGCYTHLRY